MKIKKVPVFSGDFFCSDAVSGSNQSLLTKIRATHSRAFEVQKTSSNFPQHTSQRRLQVNNFFLSLNRKITETMKSQLTSELVQYYRDNGFVVIENFLSPEELDHWQKSV